MHLRSPCATDSLRQNWAQKPLAELRLATCPFFGQAEAAYRFLAMAKLLPGRLKGEKITWLNPPWLTWTLGCGGEGGLAGSERIGRQGG